MIKFSATDGKGNILEFRDSKTCLIQLVCHSKYGNVVEFNIEASSVADALIEHLKDYASKPKVIEDDTSKDK